LTIINTLPFCDFDDKTYPIFFQHFDTKIEAAFSSAIERGLEQTFLRLPDEQLLAGLNQGRLNTLKLAQYKPGLLPIGIKKPDNHGNWGYVEPLSGSSLNNKLWHSVGKLSCTEWVASLLGITLVYYDQPLSIVAFSYSAKLGRSYFRAAGDRNLIDWFTRWIEPNTYPIGTGLAGSYSIGSIFLPILNANIVSLLAEDGNTLVESTLNRVGFSSKRLDEKEPISFNKVSLGSVRLTDKKTSPTKISFASRILTGLEGSNNQVGFSASSVQDNETTSLIANRVGFEAKRADENEN
jgi:hypothetical protein